MGPLVLVNHGVRFLHFFQSLPQGLQAQMVQGLLVVLVILADQNLQALLLYPAFLVVPVVQGDLGILWGHSVQRWLEEIVVPWQPLQL